MHTKGVASGSVPPPSPLGCHRVHLPRPKGWPRGLCPRGRRPGSASPGPARRAGSDGRTGRLPARGEGSARASAPDSQGKRRFVYRGGRKAEGGTHALPSSRRGRAAPGKPGWGPKAGPRARAARSPAVPRCCPEWRDAPPSRKPQGWKEQTEVLWTSRNRDLPRASESGFWDIRSSPLYWVHFDVQDLIALVGVHQGRATKAVPGIMEE